MSDEKKVKIEELTDDHLNDVSGGVGTNRYTCEGGCGRSYWGEVKHYVNNKPYCNSCYGNYLLGRNHERR